MDDISVFGCYLIRKLAKSVERLGKEKCFVLFFFYSWCVLSSNWTKFTFDFHSSEVKKVPVM